MTVSEFLARFDLVKPSAGQHLVRCPAHADKTPSLAVKEGNDGQILLRCHAGCETWQILAALGLNEKDLFQEKTDSPKRKIVATYDYKDESGKLLFQAIRFDPKGFAQRQPDPASPGKWIYTLQGVRRVLYRLPELKGHHSILFVEGEKDADKAWALGVPATTSPMGAGKWDPAYAQQMKQQGVLKVAIVPDNDAVGAAHATAVCAGLQAVGIEVRLCPLPGAPEHGDLSDYLARGNDLAALLALLRTAPVADPITPKAVQAAVVEAKSFKILGEQRYAMEIAREGILLEVSRVRRSSNELIGELAVKVNGHFPHARTFSEGLLSIGDLNFSSVQARGTRAKLLAERSGDKGFDWVGLVEEFTTTVIANERKGTPAVVLADLDEPDEASESWDVLGFPLLQELPEVIFGDSSSGKSYFAMYVAGMLAEQGIDVLYADWEFAPSEHRKRLKRLFRPMPRQLHYVRCEHSLRHEVDHLQEIIAKHNVKYMIADSVGFAVEGPAESQEGASAYFRYLRTLRIGTLSIAHIPKQYDDGREAQIFGSVFFKHGGRSIWFIERAKENPRGELRFGLYHRKSNIGELLAPKGFKLLFRGDRTEVEKVDIDSVDELAATLPLIERVRKELLGGPMSLKGLAEAVDSPAPSVRSILSRHKSQFVKAGNKYGLIQRAEDQPATKPDAEVEF